MDITNTPEQGSPNNQTKLVDDKSIVTPYAFGISEHLLNKPLASPVRRLCAILIDLFCVALLSSLNTLFLAGLTAITFLRANIRLARQKRFKRTRVVLSFGIAALLFTIVYGIISSINDVQNDDSDADFTGKQAIVSAALYLAWSDCQNLECKRQVSTDFGESFAQTNIPAEKFSGLAQDLVSADETLPEFEQQMLAIEAINVFTRARQDKLDALAEQEAQDQSDSRKSDGSSQNRYSIVEWVKAMISDLGLGFGWAALYFSATPTYWGGATLGKRLLGIYVVRLDGRIPTLWENFGRYGGYSAGVATGLLGFLQVFWDPNRQAIQDKISETLVLRK